MPSVSGSQIVHAHHLDEIEPRLLYRLLRLRSEVFVVEQDCAYSDMDGRDLEPGTRLWWTTTAGDPDEPVATLRVLTEPTGGHRIGRVVSAAAVRGTSIAHDLMAAALASCDGAVVVDAQSPLRRWYERHGFEVSGDEFLEDDIAHLPMRRSATTAAASGASPGDTTDRTAT